MKIDSNTDKYNLDRELKDNEIYKLDVEIQDLEQENLKILKEKCQKD